MACSHLTQSLHGSWKAALLDKVRHTLELSAADKERVSLFMIHFCSIFTVEFKAERRLNPQPRQHTF